MRYLLFLSLLGIGFFSHAQSYSMEAKAAYLLAEEEFYAGKYETAIKYLDEAAAKLGKPNAKILYLKVMAILPMAQKDEKQTTRLKEAIMAFENTPDLASFNEEKQLEVLRLKLKLRQVGNLLPPEEDMTESFSKFTLDGWKLGMTLEEAKNLKPNFFTSASKSVEKDEFVFKLESHLIDGRSRFPLSYTWVYFQNGKLRKVFRDESFYSKDAVKGGFDRKDHFNKARQVRDTRVSELFKSITPEKTTIPSDYIPNDPDFTTIIYSGKDGKVKTEIKYYPDPRVITVQSELVFMSNFK